MGQTLRDLGSTIKEAQAEINDHSNNEDEDYQDDLYSNQQMSQIINDGEDEQ